MAIRRVQIMDDAINSAKISADTVVAADIAAGGVSTSELASTCVTAAKIASTTITKSQISPTGFLQAWTVNDVGTTSTARSYPGGNFTTAPIITYGIVDNTGTATINVALTSISASSYTLYADTAGTINLIAVLNPS